MSKTVTFDYSKALQFVGQHEVDYLAESIRIAHEQLHNGTGTGSEYLGWIDLPTAYDKEEFARIQQAATKIQNDSDVLIVIGIGGSYLGARAAVNRCLILSIMSFLRISAKLRKFISQVITSAQLMLITCLI